MADIAMGRVRGIDIGVNWSVAVIASLVALSLAEGILPDVAEGYTTGEYWTAAVLGTLAFGLGLLAHELGHSIVAQREGVRVVSVTLWMFGGVAQLENTPTTPRSSLRIAAAGPAVSIAIGIAALFVALTLDGLAGATVAWYGTINLLLAGFNLLPAYPMDGGRIYQAWRWARTGNEREATERAAKLGLTIGAGLVALGVVELFALGSLGGVWLMAIGWFLREASRAEVQALYVDRPMQAWTVAQVMTTDPVIVGADETLTRFTATLLDTRHANYPVVDDAGTPVGIVDAAAVAGIDPAERARTTVGSVARPMGSVTTVSSDMSLSDALATMGHRDQHRALVVDDGRLVGILAPSDIARLAQVYAALASDGSVPGEPDAEGSGPGDP